MRINSAQLRCSDKFFSSWEPEDDPWDVLRANCPESPFVHGMSDNVPLPSAYVPAPKNAGDDESDDDGQSAGAAASGGGRANAKAGLRDYLSNAISKVASSAEGLAAVGTASQVVTCMSVCRRRPVLCVCLLCVSLCVSFSTPRPPSVSDRETGRSHGLAV